MGMAPITMIGGENEEGAEAPSKVANLRNCYPIHSSGMPFSLYMMASRSTWGVMRRLSPSRREMVMWANAATDPIQRCRDG